MTGCEQILDLISLRLDGPLGPQDQKTLDDHLAQCPSCRALAADLEGLHGAAVDLGETAPPQDFAQRVLEQIAAEGRTLPQDKVVPLFRRPALRRLGGLAACALLMVGAVRLLGPELLPRAPMSAAPAGAPPAAASAPASSAPMTMDAAPAPALFGTEGMEGPRTEQPSAGTPRSQMPAIADGDYLLLVSDALGQQPAQLLVLTVRPDQETGEEWTELEGGRAYCVVQPQRLQVLADTLDQEEARLIATGEEGPCVLLLDP